ETLIAAINALAPGRLKAELVPWSLEATWQAFEQADVVWIPVLESPKNNVKSPNRLLEPLWSGRFVAADPIPSYQPFADLLPMGLGLSGAVAEALRDP